MKALDLEQHVREKKADSAAVGRVVAGRAVPTTLQSGMLLQSMGAMDLVRRAEALLEEAEGFDDSNPKRAAYLRREAKRVMEGG